MKISILAVVLAVGCGSAGAVEPGDSYQKVIEERGAPSSRIEAGGSIVVRYPDATIKFRDGRVSEIKLETETDQVPAATKLTRVVPGQWTTDYMAATAQAVAEKKRTFLFFTGSDWCPWCKRIEREILGTKEFISYAKENLILVKVDFPRETPQSPQLMAVNARLAEHYRVSGYPTVIVLDSEGRVLGRLSYVEGGPKPFLKELKRF